jgi:hypothetical protein
MKSPASLPIAMLALSAATAPLHAQALPPITLSDLQHVSIISPVFYWNDATDVVRMASATCPKGRAFSGGVSIQKGSAALRILESYPDGESWVVRVVNRQRRNGAQTLQVRAFAVCLLPSARISSVQITQYPRLILQSHPFNLTAGQMGQADRAVCPPGTLVISGGFGRDPRFQAPSNLRMALSFPDTDAWNVRGVSEDTVQPAEVRSHAICLSGGNGLTIQNYNTVQFVSADVTLQSGASAVRQSIDCPDSAAYAIGGGARVLRGRGAAIEMQESFPDSMSSWTVAMTGGANWSGNARIRLYAVCIGP